MAGTVVDPRKLRVIVFKDREHYANFESGRSKYLPLDSASPVILLIDSDLTVSYGERRSICLHSTGTIAWAYWRE